MNSLSPPASSATPYRPLLWLAVAAGLGIAADCCLGTVAPGDWFPWWWGSGLVLVLLAERARRRRQGRLAALGLLLAAAALGGAWRHWHWNDFPIGDLARFASETPQPACVEVVLIERVKISPPADHSPLRAIPADHYSEAAVRVLAIRDGQRWRPADGLSRLRIAGVASDLRAGDHLEVFAQLARPARPLNPGQYDWSAVERRQRRLSELYCADLHCLQLRQPARRLPFATAIQASRAWCVRQLSACVDPADAPLVLATLLGDQERLSEATQDAFLKTGSIHLLVVSGAHVALLAALAWRIARGASISRRLQLLTTAAAVLLYAAIVGPQPSVMRAVMLTVATFAALVRGRTASAGNLLGAAALLVMAYNPDELFRSGTQFSFLAVAVLIALTRRAGRRAAPSPLERLIDEARPWFVTALHRAGRWLLAMTAASLAVGVALAPLVAYHFNVVTPASIVLTPLAGPLIAAALVSGVGVVTIGAIFPPLGSALGTLCGGSLHVAERLVIQAQHLPGSYFYTAGFDAWWLLVLYGAAGLWAAAPRWRPRWPWQCSAALGWLAVGLAAATPRAGQPQQLRATFLAVGHGTCVVLQLPSGQTILYDAGSLGSPESAAKTIASFLWSQRISRLDAVVLSHADVDHFNAIPGLVERFPIGGVYVSPLMFDPMAAAGRLAAPHYLRQCVVDAGIPLREVWMGDRLRSLDPDVTVEVLHPPREGVFGRDNANSLLLAVEYAGRRILLPGDLESTGMELVMSDPPLDCDVVLAPHHGSAGSDPVGFAAWCTPEYAIMSGSEPDRTASAQRSYTEAGARVFHTAEHGAIECRLTADGITFSTFRQPPGD